MPGPDGLSAGFPLTMRQQQIVAMVLAFAAGLLLGRSDLTPCERPKPRGERSVQPPRADTDGAAPRTPRPRSSLARPAYEPADRRETPSDSRGALYSGLGTGSDLEQLRSEYAEALRQLGLPESDVEAAAQQFGLPTPEVEYQANPVTPVVDPSPAELAYDLEQALLDLGITAEEARGASDRFLEQMEPSSALAEQGTDSPNSAAEAAGVAMDH